MIHLRTLTSRLSITARITAGSFVVAVLIGIVAVIGIRMGVSAILDNATLTLLRHDAEPFEEQLQRNPSDGDATPGDGQYIAIISPAGTVRTTSLPKYLRPYGRAPLSADETTTHVTVHGSEYIVRSSPVETPKGVWHVVTARNQDANDLVLGRLNAALLIGAVILVACFTLASYILARTALRPVNEMRQQADALARRQQSGIAEPTDASELLQVPPAHDELAALATTLNGLIEGLRASADRERQLVSDASHELRTPLAVLSGELELAELDAGDADALLGDVRQSQQTVLRLSTLATNLLELSRIEANQARGTSSWSELADELASSIDRMRQAAAVRGVQCVIDFEVEQGPVQDGTVSLSQQEFGRIADNLISNAIAAIGAEKGAGTVTATLTRGEASVDLTIVDDGPGMPADFLPVAFDRFTRVDVARATSTGSGLGLAIVGALVDAAGGDIQLSQNTIDGITVHVMLPVAEPDE
ncbi:hypothetical protein GCM10027568_27010 [Humibacter soli]